MLICVHQCAIFIERCTGMQIRHQILLTAIIWGRAVYRFVPIFDFVHTDIGVPILSDMCIRHSECADIFIWLGCVPIYLHDMQRCADIGYYIHDMQRCADIYIYNVLYIYIGIPLHIMYIVAYIGTSLNISVYYKWYAEVCRYIYMACRDVLIYLHDMQKCADTQICTDWHRCADIMRRDMNFYSTNIKRYTICKLLLSYARSILYAKHLYPSPYSITL